MAVRCMSLFRLGDRRAAEQAFNELASAFKNDPHARPGWAATDEEVAAIFAEAASVCGGRTGKPGD